MHYKNISFIKKFDAFSKPLEDYRIKTVSGAFITILSSFMIATLFFYELKYQLEPEINQEIFVDVVRGVKMKINLDLILLNMACDYLSIDAMDNSGEQQNDLTHDIYKIRLDLSGQPISGALRENISKAEELKHVQLSNEDLERHDNANPECGSCYGAAHSPEECCNTCASVREAYRKRGWAFPNPQYIIQCRREKWGTGQNYNDKEGCHFKGFILVNKMAGNFHIAPGKPFTQSHTHLHDIQGFGNVDFNMSHSINRISFGDDYPGVVHPLDNITKKASYRSAIYSYYITIVPTTYVYLNGSTLITNQYSVTKHVRSGEFDYSAATNAVNGIPGLYFFYEFNPMMVKITESQKSMYGFLPNICAILGGVYTVSSLLDAAIYKVLCILHAHRN